MNAFLTATKTVRMVNYWHEAKLVEWTSQLFFAIWCFLASQSHVKQIPLDYKALNFDEMRKVELLYCVRNTNNHWIVQLIYMFWCAMRHSALKSVSMWRQSINDWRSSNGEWNSQMLVCHLRMTYIYHFAKAMAMQTMVNKLFEKNTASALNF